MAFGVCWTIIFLFTNFGLAVGDPAGPTNPLRVLFWVELAVFVLAAAAFFRAEMKDMDV